MELNAEQVKKAMECCNSEGHICGKCPYESVRIGISCRDKLIRDALALINSQEQKIFELENRLKESENGYKGTNFLDRCKLHDAEEKVRKLTEENESWQKSLITEKENADKAYYELACEVEDLRAEKERLKARVLEENHLRHQAEEMLAQGMSVVKADTVRKMQKRLTKEFDRMHKSNFITVEVRQWIINQIAKRDVGGQAMYIIPTYLSHVCFSYVV